MISLDTMICDLVAPGYMRRMGDYVCQTAPGEILGVTLNVKATPAPIVGCATYTPELLDDKDIIEVTVDGRAHYPLVATAGQRMAVADPEDMAIRFREIRDCRVGQYAIIPYPENDRMNLVMAAITKLSRWGGWWAQPEFAPGVGATMATLKVERGKSYTTLAGVVWL